MDAFLHLPPARIDGMGFHVLDEVPETTDGRVSVVEMSSFKETADGVVCDVYPPVRCVVDGGSDFGHSEMGMG